MHHSVVKIGIKGLAQGWDLFNAQLGQDILELGHGHLHALFIGLVRGLLLKGPLQIVIHRKEGQRGLRLGVRPSGFLLFLAAAAVVVILTPRRV